MRIARRVGEGAHEVTKVGADGAHADHPLVEPVRHHLALVPGDEARIDGHETDTAAHGERSQQVCFAEPDYWYVQCAADFQKTRLLEMADDERVVAGTLRFDGVTDYLCRAAEFRQRVEVTIGWVKAVDFKLDIRRCNLIQIRLQPFDIRRLLDRMDEALIPDSSRSG